MPRLICERNLLGCNVGVIGDIQDHGRALGKIRPRDLEGVGLIGKGSLSHLRF
jgi:hypothetical protein